MEKKGTLKEMLIMAEVGKKIIEDMVGREISWDEDIDKLLEDKKNE